MYFTHNTCPLCGKRLRPQDWPGKLDDSQEIYIEILQPRGPSTRDNLGPSAVLDGGSPPSLDHPQVQYGGPLSQ